MWYQGQGILFCLSLSYISDKNFLEISDNDIV